MNIFNNDPERLLRANKELRLEHHVDRDNPVTQRSGSNVEIPDGSLDSCRNNLGGQHILQADCAGSYCALCGDYLGRGIPIRDPKI